MTYNIVIAGVGGQGVLTLAAIITQAAVAEGKAVKTSELHGLAQRFGPLEAHVRIGDCYSPLVTAGTADLIIGLEPSEALRAVYYASQKRTIIVSDTKTIMPLEAYLLKKECPSLAALEKELKKHCKRTLFAKASDNARQETGTSLAANSFLLGVIAGNKLLPIKPETLEKQFESALAGKKLEQNKRLFKQGLKVNYQ